MWWRQFFVISEHLLEIEDTCIMQHSVLKASGHVDRFNDFMVKDVSDESKFFRADKLLEDVMEEKLKAADLTEAQRVEYTSVRNQADAYSQQELHQIFQKYQIKSPETGNDLSEPYEFNLMFPTPIGPGGYLQGYLRPETAQGIFLNYKFCLEQNSNRLPFGVAQVGRSFRNEIAPRAGLTRQREFTQAEIEYFVNPANKAHPKFKMVKDTVLTLFHSDAQLSAQEPVKMAAGDAVSRGLINNETLAFFIVRTYQFLLHIGLDQEFVRFRQHLPTEMAHYACDCWDAEIFGSYGWLECVGIADRSAFDLNAHARAAKCDLQYKESLEKPIEREVLALTKKSGVDIMKAFKKDGRTVKEFIEKLPQEEIECIAKQLEKGTADVQVDGSSFTLTKELAVFERKMEKQTVNAFTPGVIEPSFGIDRIFASLLEHVYYARPKEEPGDDKDKQTRGVLAFAPSSAPYKCVILPLDQRIARDERYLNMMDAFQVQLVELGLSFTLDESNATIGKRYSRNDELGIPYAITFDFDTLEEHLECQLINLSIWLGCAVYRVQQLDMSLTQKDLEDLDAPMHRASTKVELLKRFFQAEPPTAKGEDLLELWQEIYDETVRNTIVETVAGSSDERIHPVLPYEKLYAIVGDGGHWKWPRIWRRFDELERRGAAYRDGDPINFGLPNPNPNIEPQTVLVVGGGPVGLRMAIELKLGGHHVTVFEKRREVRDESGQLQQLGFTNRINRPHVFNFLRNDLDRLNGRDFMSSKMCYPVFTQADTSSIGIDELQLLLLKNALLLGVDFRMGMSYEDAEIVLDPRTQKPRWKVKFTCDEQGANSYQVPLGENFQTFDVLMGCDGARSRVRESQKQIFGEVDKRNFKKMIGVVANVQKVSRQRLKDLGFPSGQEPTDMKRAHLASGAGNMAGLNYYKASFHNYVIFTPSKEDLQAAGFSGSIYSFHSGRDKVNPNKADEKMRLRRWVLERCKEVGIPVDETLSNGGFVEEPNDVMAFDFSEIWKCKKNFAFNLPPIGYDTEVHGPWTGRTLIPPIGLVGDAVTEPFWIAGVGLQRGWNGVMDACYLIDNLYNMSFSGGPDPVETTSWNEHVQKLQGMIPVLFDCSHDGKMTKEGLQGEYADQGIIMTQLNKQQKDSEKPQWQLQVNPWTRYEQFAKLSEEKYKGARILENMHPTVRRALAIRKHPNDSDVFSAKKLKSINGKSIVQAVDHVVQQSRKAPADAQLQPSPAERTSIPETEVARRASTKSENLHSMLAKQIDLHVQNAASHTARAFDDDRWKPLSPKASGFAEMAEKQWDILTEKHLSPSQRAELLHVRNMQVSLRQQIASLSTSLAAFERAEREPCPAWWRSGATPSLPELTYTDRTVTVRERDTMWQIRLVIDELAPLLLKLCQGSPWEAESKHFAAVNAGQWAQAHVASPDFAPMFRDAVKRSFPTDWNLIPLYSRYSTPRAHTLISTIQTTIIGYLRQLGPWSNGKLAGEVPSAFEPSLLESPQWVNSFHKKKAVKQESIEEDGVAEKIYANWIKEELQKEAACLELPFSVVFLASFACFALGYLAQDVVMSVENSIETDITENANFAFEGYFGNKAINDVNSIADFWSWTRLGLLPLVFPETPYTYSEGLADVVPEGYDVNALPQRWLYSGYQKPAPVQNDYLRYNRIIGGLRFRQEVSTDDKATCTHFGDEATFRRWIGKPCTHITEYELPPDLMATEAFNSEPQRVEWFLPEVEGTSALVQHVVDMEDGCFSAKAQNRTCRCTWCDAQVSSHPWLDEQTQRVEVAFITYNAHYGLYNLATANFWFSRGGNIFKLVFVRSSWAGLEVREPAVLALIAVSGVLWVCGCLYLAKVELLEMATMIQRSNKIWYYTLAQDYLGFWNCVDWLAIIMTTVISISFGVLHIFIGDVNGKLGAIVTQVDSSGYPALEAYREIARALELSRSGRKAHAASYGYGQDLQSINLRGKVSVVTGANSGIGRKIAEYLVARGSRVYMVCRNAERGQQAKDEIAQKTSSEDVHLLVADCGLASDVRRVAAELRDKEASGIDCLVCNAGAMTHKKTLTSEGHEVTFATHLLHGTYLLTEELRPALGRKEGARVVVVSSGGMLNVKYNHNLATGKKGSYDRQLAYAYAKRGQVLLCEHWAKQPGEQIVFASCHPGWTDTPGVDHAYGSMKKWLEPMRTNWEGQWQVVCDSFTSRCMAVHVAIMQHMWLLSSPWWGTTPEGDSRDSRVVLVESAKFVKRQERDAASAPATVQRIPKELQAHTYRTVSDFADAVVAMLDAERNLRLWLCIYPVVLLMRLFKSFAAQKRLAIVTDTFRMAYNDLMHFFIVFASVYFCMTVNAVIFFGQDILDFATIDRALHACFRAMLGDWDWDAMGKIGIHRAFAWFFFFMVVMVMILMNMLVAILMEAYGVVKDDAKHADSLLQQTKNILRRARQNKRKERVNLTHIWDALRKEHNDDEDALLSSERKITPSFLRDIVDGIPVSQALRTLKNSQMDHDKKVDPAFELQDFKVGLTNMVTRLDYSALCATYLSEKIRQYQDLAKAEGRDTGGFDKSMATLSPVGDFEGAPAEDETYENSAEQALEKVKALARDHSTEMADGIAAILGEEMQELEKRQNTQRKAINTTCEQLQRLRDMVHHLSSTCADISNLTAHLGSSSGSAHGASAPRVILDGRA
ncbi:Gars1 [Symbiodinium natans]|uniref:glycine--tRNA ligase n=1 Tax=Symbiodinium natans TaxID=878477 RepID=A0A812HM90_9DINO|nr:Gars1 [Symbiodinium natans]